MYAITGATGRLGHSIVQRLAALIPASQIVATCRDPGKAADLAALGVQVRRANFDDPISLARAFEGATQVLIVSSNARAYGGNPLAQHGNAIAAAHNALVKRIVYTSHVAASVTSAFPPMHDHAATEKMLRDSGIAWTALRHGFYSSSGIAMLMPALQSGLLETALDGPVSWTAHEDLAEAAVRILLSPSMQDGPTAPLTGPEALDLSDLCLAASQLLGTQISRRVLPDQEMRATLLARGVAESVVNISLGFCAAARNKEFALVEPTLRNLLGRPPITMRHLLAQAFGTLK